MLKAKSSFVSHRLEREREIKGNLQKGMKKAVEIVKNQAKADVPVRTGKLQKSITGKVQSKGNNIIGRVEVGEFYAHFIEFGTQHSSPQPFLFPAVEKKRNEIREALSHG